MKKLLIQLAVVEGLSGLILLVYPPIVIRLLFDSEIAGAAGLDESDRRHHPDRVGSGLLAGQQHSPGFLWDVDL
jgi:hypothetical protein